MSADRVGGDAAVECEECGAVVTDTVQHKMFHVLLEQRLDDLFERVGSQR